MELAENKTEQKKESVENRLLVLLRQKETHSAKSLSTESGLYISADVVINVVIMSQ